MTIPITPVEGFPITSVEGDGEAIEPNSDGTYTLAATKEYPKSLFKVTVASSSAPSYGENGFTADGSAYDPDATAYVVTTAAQLATIAAGVNAGDAFTGKTVTLGSDVSLAAYEDWTPIGTSDAPFAGTFDGAGHTVSDLSITTAAGGYRGLFGWNTGLVKDFAISGSIGTADAYITSGADNIGGTVGYNDGTVSGITSSVTVFIRTGSIYAAGGIVGQNGDDGVITRCINNGAVNASKASGGVCGRSYGTISECVNTGDITGNQGGKDGIGGITGLAGMKDAGGKDNLVSDCYNTGTISNNDGRWHGGIAGFAEHAAVIQNCYDIGQITTGYSWNWNPIIGHVDGGSSNPTVSNNYSLEGLNAGDTDASTKPLTIGTVKTEEEFKSAAMVTLLGDAWRLDTDDINGGYPVLAWQGGSIVISYGANGFTADGSAYDPDAESYTVTTTAQLKTVADGVNLGDTFTGKTVTLAADVSLADYEAWTPIGGAATQHPLTLTSQEDLDAALEEHFLIYDSVGASYVRGSDKNGLYDPNRSYYYVTGAAFAGIFDGAGYAVTDLTVNTSDGYAGLFGNVSGTVKDLTVSGSVTSTTRNDFVGGITGKLSAGGLIEGCVSNVTVYAGSAYNIGGIAGFVGEMGTFVSETNPMATVRNCVNNGNVSGYVRTGGIAGRSAGTVEGCVNTGKIFNISGQKKGTGGIVGMNGVNNAAADAGIIVNCYNLGEVDGHNGYWAGGIAGFSNAASSVSYCYNAGPITKDGVQTTTLSWTNPTVGQSEGSVSDCLFLDTTVGRDSTGVGNAGGTVTNVVMKTADELKAPASVTFLNGDGGDAWNADDAADPISGGYPVLAWQGGTPVAAAATLTLEDNFEEPAEGYFTAAGITVTPSASDLSFTVTCDSACVVAIENADGTYTILEDTGSEGVHQYTAGSADDVILVAVKGDASGDGACDIDDVMFMVDSFMGAAEFSPLQTLLADSDNSGTIDITDVLAAVDAYTTTPFNW